MFFLFLALYIGDQICQNYKKRTPNQFVLCPTKYVNEIKSLLSIKGQALVLEQVLIEKFEKVSNSIQKLSPRKNNSREDEEKPSEESMKMSNRKTAKEQKEQTFKENQVFV